MKNAIVCVLALGVLASSASVSAEDEVLRQDPINIDGYVKADAEVSDRELEMINNELTKQKTTIKLNKSKTKKYKKLQDTTEKLANETEEYIAEKQASQKAIDKYNKKINCLMDNVQSAECDKILGRKRQEDIVSTMASSTQAVNTQVKASEADEKTNIRITPYTGINSYRIDNGNLETETLFGFKAEAEINTKFSAGAFFQYSSMGSQNVETVPTGVWTGLAPGSQVYMEVDYTIMELGLLGKYFVLNKSKFKPYASAAMSYSRLTVGSASYQAQDNLNANYALAKAAIGADFNFTKNFGINIEAGYAKPIYAQEVKQTYLQNFSELLLTQQANLITDTEILSFNVGFNVMF